jgi:hypothetical protein
LPAGRNSSIVSEQTVTGYLGYEMASNALDGTRLPAEQESARRAAPPQVNSTGSIIHICGYDSGATILQTVPTERTVASPPTVERPRQPISPTISDTRVEEGMADLREKQAALEAAKLALASALNAHRAGQEDAPTPPPVQLKEDRRASLEQQRTAPAPTDGGSPRQRTRARNVLASTQLQELRSEPVTQRLRVVADVARATRAFAERPSSPRGSPRRDRSPSPDEPGASYPKRVRTRRAATDGPRGPQNLFHDTNAYPLTYRQKHKTSVEPN